MQHAFWYISMPSMHDYDVHGEDNRQFPILLCQLLGYRLLELLELNSIKIHQNWKIQRWIKAMKFKTARNSLFKWRFQCWSRHLRRRWYELEQHKRQRLQLERQKSDRFRLAKTTPLLVHRAFFVHFVTARLRCDRKCLNSLFVGLILYGVKTCMWNSRVT